MKDGTGAVAIEEFIVLKPEIYLILIGDNSEYKKSKGVNEYINHNEYKDVLLNQKDLRHLMNRTQSKNNKIGTYEIKNVFYHTLMTKCIS